jgi:putative transposase
MLVPLRKAIELTGLSSTTLRKYGDNGFIKSTKGKGGHRLFDVDELVNYGKTEEPKGNPVVCYCRVSSKKQNDDLVRQVPTCDTNSQMPISSKISVADSTLKEKVLKPFWNDACTVIGSHLLSHTEIDSVGLGLNLSNTLSSKMVEKSWFSTNLTHRQNQNLPQTCLQSYMSSLAVCMDSEGTLTKSRRIRIYPTKEQKIRFKGWFGVSRLFYNNTIDHYNNPDKDTINWMGVAKGLTDGLTQDYVKTTPYQVKKIAVKDGYQSFITNVRKTKKTGKEFKLGFRSKKNPVQGCYIPKTAVKDEGIYHTIAGKLKYSERLGLVNKDCRLIYDNGRRFISIPTEYSRKMFIENQEDIIAIDPGVRSFVSLFSAMGVYGHIGKTDFSTIQRLGICSENPSVLNRVFI